MGEHRHTVWVSHPLPDDIVGQLKPYFEVNTTAEVIRYTQADIAAQLANVDGAVVTLNERIGAAEVAGAPRLRAIANVGVGYNNLDLNALSAAGIIASNTPEVLTQTTADLGFALMLAAARRITEYWQRWSFTDMLGMDVYGRTLGILGMGRIGQAIAHRGHHGFSMPVIYHNRSRLIEADERKVGARYVSFEELLRQADHLVIVLPYSSTTHHLINAPALALMKPSATLVNIARGGIVDEIALADALAQGRLAAAGLDVYEGEPAVRPELTALSNIVLTPHIGSASHTTRRAMAQLAVDNLIAALGYGAHAGHPPNAINLDSLPPT